jgi:hypothetical protein
MKADALKGQVWTKTDPFKAERLKHPFGGLVTIMYTNGQKVHVSGAFCQI